MARTIACGYRVLPRAGLDAEHALGRRPHGHPTARVDLGEGGHRFEIGVILGLGLIYVLDHHIACGPSAVGVAGRDLGERERVSRRNGRKVFLVVLVIPVHQFRAGVQRRLDIQDRRQFLVFDGDQGRGFQCASPVLGGDGRDRLADIADRIDGERGLVAHHQPETPSRDIGAGDHGPDARNGDGRVDIVGENSRMGGTGWSKPRHAACAATRDRP